MGVEREITTRQASIFDLDLVAPLFDAYRVFYRKPSDPELAREFLLERFQHNESVIFIAQGEGGAALGFVQLFPSFSSGAAARILILNDLFVVPQARRRGVGKLLLQAACEYGKAARVVRLTLATEVVNTGAQALYESQGWKRQRDFVGYDLSIAP